jgi:hypothetical protein
LIAIAAAAPSAAATMASCVSREASPLLRRRGPPAAPHRRPRRRSARAGRPPLAPNDPVLAHPDAEPLEPSAHSPRQVGRTIRAEQHVAAPHGEAERECGARLAAAVARERPVSPFPSVAVGAVMDAPAVERLDAVQRGQLVHHAGGQQEGAGSELRAVVAVGAKVLAVRRGVHHPSAPKRHRRIGPELLARQRQQPGRLDSIAGEKAVQRLGSPVARLAGVAHHHLPPAAAQHERRAQAGRACPDDEAVVSHGWR